jgi:hypothetical protein
MENIEIWKDIENYEYYKISNLGRVKSLSRNRRCGKIFYITKEMILKPTLGQNGYFYITSLKNTIHRLIAISFIPNPHNYPCVNHINGIKTDNRVENLEWCTYSQNNKHAYDTKLKIPHERQGTSNPCSKLTEKEVLEIREIGNKLSTVKLGNIYNIHPSMISLILKRKNWTHI